MKSTNTSRTNVPSTKDLMSGSETSTRSDFTLALASPIVAAALMLYLPFALLFAGTYCDPAPAAPAVAAESAREVVSIFDEATGRSVRSASETGAGDR